MHYRWIVIIALFAPLHPTAEAAKERRPSARDGHAEKHTVSSKASIAKRNRRTKRWFLPLDAREYTLPSNGLRIIMIPAEFKDTVALYTVVQAGSGDEGEGEGGLTHVIEHLLGDGGNAQRRMRERLDTLGIYSNAGTGKDNTTYELLLHKQDLEEMLALQANNLKNPTYSKRLFKKEANVIASEERSQKSQPLLHLIQELNHTLFPGHGYGHPIVGTEADLAGMVDRYSASKRFYERRYRPDRTTILLIGDIEPQKVLSLVKRHWSGWKRDEGDAPSSAQAMAESPSPGPVNLQLG